ncbi:cadmium-translocating P-type ATPase [Salicibibacter halophilus]|uniref:Cd(2+)-exporting ATPase n=1 Tax=Salicibibacter halophilus TaxID=2502791 RepID=A0A514LJZ6_9BACI|nr:cation-translocating P-type ATPase [Salicibibacter halophilus]QDI92152.1 cadmium-translocating P-type ATPase [Salicibibacter halophilus]
MISWVHKQTNRLTFIAGALLIIALIAFLTGYTGVQQSALIIATVVAGVPIAIKAIQSLSMKAFSIDLLVTIAIVGALFIGEYVESAVVSFLFLFGAYLEARTLKKTRSSIKELVDMAPQEAVVSRNGESVTIPVEDVVEGDRVIIRPGGKIPVDGSILTGEATLNEAAITGESIPVSKTKKDEVFSGTIVDNGYIEMEAEEVGDDTTFAKIIELVEEAQDAKSNTQRFLDRFANIYTPAIIVLSVLVFLTTLNLHLAIIFLVVACPGALVIGAPVSNVAGIGNGARKGALVKGGDVMDRFSKVDTIVFDKTGTLTKGKPEVTHIQTFNGQEPDELLRLVAEAETMSEHHLGRTIVKEAQERDIPLKQKVEKGEVVKGNGVWAIVEGQKLVVGNQTLMDNEGISIPENVKHHAIEREKDGNTAILAAVDGQIKGIVSIADQVRDDAAQAIAELRENGIKKLIMMTGDNEHTAALVAHKLGLDEFHAKQLPEDKQAYVEKLQNEGYSVAMAGDGINDAPAIATADIGVAMGEGGTDVSMETADLVLMADRLGQFSHAYALSKATMRNLKQNIIIALGTVFLLLGGVVAGYIHMATGMFIHMASVLVVILNAMRLIRFKRQKNKSETMAKKAETKPA